MMRGLERACVRAAAARDGCAQLAGWRHRFAALGLGAASVLAMAPFFAWPVLFATLPGLVWLIDARLAGVAAGEALSIGWWRRRMRHPIVRAATTAWWFGFGYHLVGLFWIGEAFLVEAEKFAVLMPFAVTLMPAGLALFWAAAAAVTSFAWRPGFERVLALAITIAAAEWLRGHVLTGFPWNVLGYALTWPLPLMQAASVCGIYGLTLLAVLIFATPGVLLAAAVPIAGRSERAGTGRTVVAAHPANSDTPAPRPSDFAGSAAAHSRTSGAGSLRPTIWQAWLPVAGPLGVLAALFGLGLLRLAGPEPVATTPAMVRIVQPSVPQREKWRPENQERIFRQHLDMSVRNARGEEDGARGIKLIVWPEAAMPFLPLRSAAALAAIGEMLPAETVLASGTLHLVELAAGGHRDVYNSLMVFGAGGQRVAHYDKIHLVPFGEYLPLQSTLEAIGLEQLSRLRGGFSAGVKPRPLLTLPGLPILGPLICYEAIFPAAIVQGAERPQVLLNVTNDGWFGNTTGPRQHFHQTRVRAVEEGLPILRAANNGISAIIDANGRVLARTAKDEVATLDGSIPASLPPPPYARFGDAIFGAMLLAAIFVAVILRQPGAIGLPPVRET